MQLSPYLSFNGNCAEAMKFYQQVLGGEMVAMQTYAGTPAAEHVSPELSDKIIHARLVFGENVLMASDGSPDQFEPMKGIAVTLNIPDQAEAERVFHALSAGGSITMPIAETFWAVRFGMLTDKFGTPWMINCEKPM